MPPPLPGRRAIAPMPDPPDSGLAPAARYFIDVIRGRHQRRAGMRALAAEIQAEVGALDSVLGALGRAARALKLQGRPLVDENRAIDEAERRREEAEKGRADVARRIEDEQTRFVAVDRELSDRLAAADSQARAAAQELERRSAARRETREKKKQIERKQREYLKGAERREKQAESLQGDQRGALRRSAEDLRGDAARLEPERADLERAAAGLDEDVARASTRHDTARADLDAARRALEDARAGHRHRRGELDAEAGQRARAADEANGEIGRRLVTLGTLLNLNRIAGADTDPLYQKVDALKQAIAGREKEVERLRGEIDRVDKAIALRGAGVIAAALVLLITVITVILMLR